MSKPVHTGEPKFPTLNKGVGRKSTGTVTCTPIAKHDKVTIISKYGNMKWEGEVTTCVTGDTWKAEVEWLPPTAKDEEEQTKQLVAVLVTVTNGSGTSDPAETQSDVVP
jgi:hypothetical protein